MIREKLNERFGWFVYTIIFVLLLVVFKYSHYHLIPILELPVKLSLAIFGKPEERDFLPIFAFLIFNGILTGFISLPIIKRLNIKYPKKYVVCPKCDKSILVYTKWTCDHCNNTQKKEHYITNACDHCGREIKSVFCEYCGEEINL